MAFKGTASKSSSGASMSKYDVEVEARLQALEKGLADCKAQCAANSHTHGASSGGTVSVSGLKEATKGLGPEAKINTIIDALS